MYERDRGKGRGRQVAGLAAARKTRFLIFSVFFFLFGYRIKPFFPLPSPKLSTAVRLSAERSRKGRYH